MFTGLKTGDKDAKDKEKQLMMELWSCQARLTGLLHLVYRRLLRDTGFGRFARVLLAFLLLVSATFAQSGTYNWSSVSNLGFYCMRAPYRSGTFRGSDVVLSAIREFDQPC